NVDSEWGISRGDYEQGARIAALEIRGGDGNDRLFGGAQGDTIYGGEGADLIMGGGG
nr:calcium-binding protein [Desulfuromonadales bacterium]